MNVVKVTLQDIAEELAVSPATVSRSLRNDPLIHPETRSRVNETALRLGYKGSSGRLRRSEKRIESGALGLLLHADTIGNARHDQNLVQMMEGIMAAADRHGFLLNVHTIHRDQGRSMEDDPAAVPSLIRDNVCRAVILRGAHEARDVAYMADRVPVISLSRIYRGLKLDAVVPDDVEGVRALVTRLIDLGHRRMAWVGGRIATTFYEGRQAGFVMGCLGGGLDLREQHFFGPEIFKNRLLHDINGILNAMRGGTTALVCANDFLARQVIDLLDQEGVRVPEDVSVTGFDALLPRTMGDRQVTSVNPHFFEMGYAAVRLAMQRLSEPSMPPQVLVVGSEIVPGETIAPV
jgi:DNA-binding LacI/PurR family transcriptional regulator